MMRFYGTIETNLGELLKEYGLSKYVSIDSLTFDTGEDCFYIDFDETDIVVEDKYIDFRLKSLGATYADSWGTVGISEVVDMENNKEIFNKVELSGIVVYVYDFESKLDDEFLNRVKFKMTGNLLVIGDTEIEYENEGVEVEIYIGG